jgi:hypothetical protein
MKFAFGIFDYVLVLFSLYLNLSDLSESKKI